MLGDQITACLEFDGVAGDDDLVVHEQIQPVQSYFDASVHDGDGQLSDEGNATMAELHDEGCFVDGLQKSRPQFPVDSNADAVAAPMIRPVMSSSSRLIVDPPSSWIHYFMPGGPCADHGNARCRRHDH